MIWISLGLVGEDLCFDLIKSIVFRGEKEKEVVYLSKTTAPEVTSKSGLDDECSVETEKRCRISSFFGDKY